MKKVLAAILAAALLVSAAAACGSDTADPSGGTPESAGASGAADASAQEPYTVKLLIPGDNRGLRGRRRSRQRHSRGEVQHDA